MRPAANARSGTSSIENGAETVVQEAKMLDSASMNKAMRKHIDAHATDTAERVRAC